MNLFFQAFIMLLASNLASSFVPVFKRVSPITSRAMHMVKVDVTARDFELSQSLNKKIDDKIGKALSKFRLNYISSHVVLRLHKFPSTEVHSHSTKKDSQIAEITVNLKGGYVIHLTERSEDMYATIDMLSHKLFRRLRQFKEKYRSKNHNDDITKHFEEEVEETSEEADEFASMSDEVDLLEAAQAITKEKIFEMPAMTPSEAAETLGFVDHPFYVFRNKLTDEVNVVYKRSEGGVGHIMPKK